MTKTVLVIWNRKYASLLYIRNERRILSLTHRYEMAKSPER